MLTETSTILMTHHNTSKVREAIFVLHPSTDLTVVLTVVVLEKSRTLLERGRFTPISVPHRSEVALYSPILIADVAQLR